MFPQREVRALSRDFQLRVSEAVRGTKRGVGAGKQFTANGFERRLLGPSANREKGMYGIPLEG